MSTRDESGFTLVELLVVLVIVPIIAGGIATVVISSLQQQSRVSGRLSDSSSAQITSAVYVRDVQSAAYITTSSTTTAPPPCGSGTTFLLGLNWGSPTAGGTVVSYWANPSTATLARLYCVIGSNTPVSSQIIAHGLSPNLGIQVVVAPSTIASAAATDWTATAGISSVSLGALESSSIFNFDLLAVPRLSNPQSLNVSPGGNPTAPPLFLLGGGGAPMLACTGNGTLNVNGAAYLDSTANPSATLGGNTIISATQIVTADPSLSTAISTSGHSSYSPAPISGGVQPDPYAGLTPPSPGAPPPSPTTGGGVTTYYPGTYASTLSLSGGTNVLATGTYIFQNGINISGNARLSSAPGGVFLYVTGGTISFSGNGSVSLSPLTPPLYPSVAPNLGIWQAAADTNLVTMTGNGSVNTFSGGIYAPTAQVGGTGNAGYTAGSVIAKSLSCVGNATTTIG